MRESGYYPLGAEFDKNAPYNEKGFSEKEIEVCISITLSKTVKIKVSDYKIIDSGKDEDGNYFEDIDYSECDLHTAVEEQIVLPQETCKNWNVDEMEVILE